MANHGYSYSSYVRGLVTLFLNGLPSSKQAAYAQLKPLVPIAGLPANPIILIISPHPDDECLMGGYALRMAHEWGAMVYVLPFSYGSHAARQNERKKELQKAVPHLGFRLHDPRDADGSTPVQKLSIIDIEKAMLDLNADVVFSPHREDRHLTHVECAIAVEKAFDSIRKSNAKSHLWIQTEFWGELAHPNVLIPLSSDHVIRLGEALELHEGEVTRNPFHLRLPAWYMDQVRRGSELVQGAGTQAMDTVFGQLYSQHWIK